VPSHPVLMQSLRSGRALLAGLVQRTCGATQVDGRLEYGTGRLPFDDYGFRHGEEFQWYEDLTLDDPGQYRPSILCHFTSDDNIAGILENGPLSAAAGFGEGLYCVDEDQLHLEGPEAMSRVFILQNMYCKLAYMDREPCDTGLLTRRRFANAYVRLDVTKLLEDGRFGVLRILNGQTNKFLTNYVVYKKAENDQNGVIPDSLDARRSLNVWVKEGTSRCQRSLLTPFFFAVPSHGFHPEFDRRDTSTHVPATLQVQPEQLVSARDWPQPVVVGQSKRYQAPVGTAFRDLQGELHRISIQYGAPWQYQPLHGLRGAARKEHYLAQERERLRKKGKKGSLFRED